MIGLLLFAVTLVRFGNIEDGYRFGHLAMRIFERFPSRQLHPKVIYLFWVAIQTEKESFRSCLAPLWKSYKLGMKIGDIEIAMAAAVFHCTFRIYLGDHVDEIFKVANKLANLCLSYGQEKVHTLACTAMQACQNLQGKSMDPLTFTGSFLNEKESIESLKKHNLKSLTKVIFHCKHMVATLMNEYKAADALYRNNKKLFADFILPPITIYFNFHSALVSIGLVRDESSSWKKRIRLGEARRWYNKLERLLKHCPENITNKLYLIEAEMEFCRGRYSTALLKYKKSISYAQRESFVSDHALACEKAGRMLRHAGRNQESVQYFEQARTQYSLWGALLKVQQMDKLIASSKG